MIRITALALFLASGAQMRGQSGTLDPLFDAVPFRTWLASGPQSAFRWSMKVAPVHLSQHQRLATQVEAHLDGAELAKRRGTGELLLMVQFADADGRLYQDHHTFALEKIEEGVKKTEIVYSQPVFLRPGDYQVTVALYATVTKEHSVKKELVHIAPLKVEPLPDAWNLLPPVEFIRVKETPDTWFLPDIQDRLNLRLTTQRPLRIEAVVNLTPSDRAAGSFRAQDRNLSGLLPALKALAHVEGRDFRLNVSLLDLSRRKVTFRQENVHQLDWEGIRNGLQQATPGSIDVKSLEDRQHNAAFFVSEVERLLAGDDAPVVIVLSGPVEFEQGQELRPVLTTPTTPKGRLIYVRYYPSLRPVTLNMMRAQTMARSGMGSPMAMPPRPPRIPVDQLEPMVKQFNPELFETHSAEEYRKVLADLIREAPHW